LVPLGGKSVLASGILKLPHSEKDEAIMKEFVKVPEIKAVTENERERANARGENWMGVLGLADTADTEGRANG